MTAAALPVAPTAVALEARGLRLPDVAAAPDARVELALGCGELVLLLGASGAGKSALLRTCLGLAQPADGRALLLGQSPAALGRRARRALLARVGVLFEHDALFADRPVAENVDLALGAAVPALRPAARRQAVRQALMLVGLKHVEHERPAGLAPGVRRRVALARAVVHEPELLLVDEPAAGLDAVAATAVYALLAQLRERLALTVLATTREPARGLAIADRAAFLHDGRIAVCAPPSALAARADPALRQLLAGRVHGPIAP